MEFVFVGKTTTFRMLTADLDPSLGDAKFMGKR